MSTGRMKLVLGDGRQGYPSDGPYNAIHVGAAADKMPQPVSVKLTQYCLMCNIAQSSRNGTICSFAIYMHRNKDPILYASKENTYLKYRRKVSPVAFFALLIQQCRCVPMILKPMPVTFLTILQASTRAFSNNIYSLITFMVFGFVTEWCFTNNVTEGHGYVMVRFCSS